MFCSTHKFAMLVLGALCFAGVQSSRAGEFKVINRSSDRIYVVVHHWVTTSGGGLAGATQFGVDDSADYWKTHGWLTVEPGRSRVVYDGPRDRIYVRMTRRSGITGDIIKPNSQFGHSRQLVHENAFTITRDDDLMESRQYHFTGGSGAGAAEFRGSESQLRRICKLASGFYFVNSHTDFTVYSQAPAPTPPQPAAPAPIWRGVYHSQYGRLELVPNGNTWEGYMNYPNGGRGRLTGQVVNGRLRFNWWHSQDRGHGELTMLPGGRELNGWFVAREGRKPWRLTR